MDGSTFDRGVPPVLIRRVWPVPPGKNASYPSFFGENPRRQVIRRKIRLNITAVVARLELHTLGSQIEGQTPMDTTTAADATAEAISTIGSYFMLNPATYQRGGELGFAGFNFYVAGRGGVLGNVDADLVTAAFAYFEPAYVRTQWESGIGVMEPLAAAQAFAETAANWAEAHVPDDFDAARLAELADKLAEGARVTAAPLFAGWRKLEVPESPKAAAIHHLNALRELRGGIHAACIVASGLDPLQALAISTPMMATAFGWTELPEVDGLRETWEQAEEATTAAFAYVFESLTEAEREEFATLVNALYSALKG